MARALWLNGRRDYRSGAGLLDLDGTPVLPDLADPPPEGVSGT
jgi:hypothetical protein